ncbi:MAG: spherulation-specific family 4 protein [Acidimicrobiales bacterium]
MTALPAQRHRRALLLAVLCLLAVLPFRGGVTGADVGADGTTAIAQHLAVPAYIDPTADPGAWTQLDSSQPGTVGMVVANVDSGPNSQADPGWTTAIDQAHAQGDKVLGYVDTGYLGSPITGHPDGLLTRAGQTGLQAWLPQAEADINAWYQFYGPDIDGIFFDEGTNQCGPTPSSDEYADEYAALTAYVKQAHPGATTVINPGTAVPQCYENAADVLVTFEGSYGDYTGDPVSAAEAYQPLSWSSTDPNKFWHIVYGTATQAQMEQVISLSKSRNAGYIYVTDAVPANPYDTLPPAAYWADEQQQSLPGDTDGSAPPSAPTDLTESGQGGQGGQGQGGQGQGGQGGPGGGFGPGQSDQGQSSTQVQLQWNSSYGVAAPVVAYDVYEGTTWLGSVDANTLEYTVSGLAPSSTETFTVEARDAAGNESGPSQSLQVTTASATTVLPTAPWTLAVTATSFTTATLEWSPATATDESVAGYVVSENGTPILQVPASLTTVTVQGLQPGLDTDTFTVTTLGSSGNVSPASNQVVATTTPLPDDQDITAPSVQVNADGSITYGADFATPFAFRRVFIATGATGVPCWDTGNASPICADYLIENDQLLQYAGTGTDFTWTTVDSAIPTLTGTDHYSWTVPATDLASPAAQTILFNGDGYSPESYTDLVGQGETPQTSNPPYTAAQAPQLTSEVEAAVAQADSVPPPASTGEPAPASSPLCPASPDNTWYLTRTAACLSGTFSVSQSLEDGLLPVAFTLDVVDVVDVAGPGRSWVENATVVLQPGSGQLPYYSVTLAPTCSDACATVTPVQATLVPGQPFTAQFTWTDSATTVDMVGVATQATLVPQLPAIALPFTPGPQSSTVGWSTPVLRCDSVRGAAQAGCVFPQSIPTFTGLSEDSPSDGRVAWQVANDQQNESPQWGLEGAGPPLAFTSNAAIVQANADAGCSGFFQMFWVRPWCDEYPFASTYQGASQATGGSMVLAPPSQINAAESALADWEASQHVLDGDQYWVQVGT